MVEGLVMDRRIPTPAVLQAAEVAVGWKASVVTSCLCRHQNLHYAQN
jgi:hypothetical protein